VAEDFDCIIAIRGESLRGRLMNLDAKKIAESCKSRFKESRINLPDVSVEQVCRSEAEIRRYRDEILVMINSERPKRVGRCE
jgi:hypothetical protein